jgi:hypothetical protein
MLSLYLGLKSNQEENSIKHASSKYVLVSYFTYPTTLKMEAKYSSEQSVDFQRSARRYIAENKTLGIYIYIITDFLLHCKFN